MLLALQRGLRYSCHRGRFCQHAASYTSRRPVRQDDDDAPSFVRLSTRKSPKANRANDKATGHAQENGDHAGSAKELVARREKNLKLLEDLFPVEARRARLQAREVPRVPLVEPTESAPARVRYVDDSNAARARRSMKEQGMQSSLLVLRNASKNLTLEDFQRLIPRGKHLERWRLNIGDIVKVIPGRDLVTLERKNYYYILFTSPLSAFTYQTRATQISRLVQSQTPRAADSPLPPAPGSSAAGNMIAGEDVHELMQSYTLTPASQELSLRQLAPPLTSVPEQMIRCHGYAEIVERPDKSPFEVVLRFEGMAPSFNLLSAILKRIEHIRGIPWTGEVAESWTLSKWEYAGEAPSPLSDVREGKQSPDHDDDSGFDAPWKESDQEMKPRNEYERNEEQRLATRARRQPPASFIVGLQSEVDSTAFARYWHKRVLTEGTIRNGNVEEAAPVVNAEVLW